MTDRWALARAGQGQMVIISGEAGIGKSRIKQAVIEEIAKDSQCESSRRLSVYRRGSVEENGTQTSQRRAKGATWGGGK